MTPGLSDFLKTNNMFNKNDITYNVVSIIGAESSGKSTLLNYLFDTKF